MKNIWFLDNGDSSFSSNILRMFLNTVIEENYTYKKTVDRFIKECYSIANYGSDYEIDLDFYDIANDMVNEKTIEYFKVVNVDSLKMYDYIKVRSFFNDGYTHRYVKIDNLLDE